MIAVGKSAGGLVNIPAGKSMLSFFTLFIAVIALISRVCAVIVCIALVQPNALSAQ